MCQRWQFKYREVLDKETKALEELAWDIYILSVEKALNKFAKKIMRKAKHERAQAFWYGVWAGDFDL